MPDLPDTDDDILSDQIEFLMEADALKQVERKTSILGGSRKENSAEHSWHLMLTAMVMAEHANVPVDLLRVMKMLAVHDLGEIEAGDTMHYGKSDEGHLAEHAAVQEMFSLLPENQASEFMALWTEFAEAHTAEAKFAHALDRVWPIIQNHQNEGGSWAEYQLTHSQVYDRNQLIDNGSKKLWGYIEELISDAVAKGFLIP
jgi:putative hydrolase of HD superfamily